MTFIGLVVRPGIDRAAQLAAEISLWVTEHGHSLAVDEATDTILRSIDGFLIPTPTIAPHADLVSHCGIIITLGGDGTLIGLARHISLNSPPLLGVNFGNLGFLTEISPHEVFPVLEKVLSGNAALGERRMIRATIVRNGQEIFSSQALNDAVLQKEASSRLLEIDLDVNGYPVMRVRADGLITATPTGSTAYALAAGGSIVHPSLEVMLITSICPHSLTVRPLILSLDDVATVTMPPYDGHAVLTLDGQVSHPLLSGDKIQYTRAKHVAKIVLSPTRNYFEILRNKLNWGIANRAE